MTSFAKVSNVLGAINQYDLMATSNIPLTGVTASTPIDGVVMTNGMYVVLQKQTTTSDNGVYIVGISGANYTLTLFLSLNTSTTIATPAQFTIAQGDVYNNSLWKFTLINGITTFTNITTTLGITTIADLNNGNDNTGLVNNSFFPFKNIQNAIDAIGASVTDSGYLAIQPVTPIQGYNSFNISGHPFEALEIFGTGNNIDITDGGTSLVSDTNGIIVDITIANILFNNVSLINAGGGLYPPTYINCAINNLTIDNLNGAVPAGGMPGAPLFQGCTFVSTTNIFPTQHAVQTTPLTITYENCIFQSGIALNGTTTILNFIGTIGNLPSIALLNGATVDQISFDGDINNQTSDYSATMSDYGKQISVTGGAASELVIDFTILPPGWYCYLKVSGAGTGVSIVDGNLTLLQDVYQNQFVLITITEDVNEPVNISILTQEIQIDQLNFLTGTQISVNANPFLFINPETVGNNSILQLPANSTNPSPGQWFTLNNIGTYIATIQNPDNSENLANISPGQQVTFIRNLSNNGWVINNVNQSAIIPMTGLNPTYTLTPTDSVNQVFNVTGTGAIIYLQSTATPFKGQVFNITNESTSTQSVTIKDSLAGGATITTLTVNSSQKIYFNGTTWIIAPLQNFSQLSASQAVVTDANKNLISMAFSAAGGINNLLSRDANGNILVNNYFASSASTVSANGTTILTAASARVQVLTGSQSQNYQLPDATTVAIGFIFIFNNNSSGSLVIKNAGGTTLYTVPAGGIVQGGPLDISTSNGVWDWHPLAPLTVTWGSGTTGLVMNTALTTSPAITGAIASATNPVFIPQRGTANTGYSGDSTNLYGVVGGVKVCTMNANGVATIGFSATEGSNAKQGIATLTAGTVVVSNTSVTANSRIFLTAQSLGTVTVPSALCVSARTAGTSFTILASDATDTSVIAYEIFEPA